MSHTPYTKLLDAFPERVFGLEEAASGRLKEGFYLLGTTDKNKEIFWVKNRYAWRISKLPGLNHELAVCRDPGNVYGFDISSYRGPYFILGESVGKAADFVRWIISGKALIVVDVDEVRDIFLKEAVVKLEDAARGKQGKQTAKKSKKVEVDQPGFYVLERNNVHRLIAWQALLPYPYSEDITRYTGVFTSGSGGSFIPQSTTYIKNWQVKEYLGNNLRDALDKVRNFVWGAALDTLLDDIRRNLDSVSTTQYQRSVSRYTYDPKDSIDLDYEDIHRKFQQSTYYEPQETKMSKVINQVKDTNVAAAKLAAKVTAGKALNTAVMTKVTPMLPDNIKLYADTPFGALVVANIVAAALNNFASNNHKAKLAGEAMVTSAMLDVSCLINVEGLIKDFLQHEAVSELMDSIELEVG